MGKGKVFIVGEGPGNYKQITIKAFECIRKADVILFDKLLDNRILNYAKVDTILIDLKKISRDGSNSLKKIILENIIKRKTIVKLVCGEYTKLERDNEYVFLKDNDIEHEYVYNVSLPISVSSYAGIPIVDEESLSSLHVIHKNEKKIEYKYIANQSGTLIFFSKYKNLDDICNGLLENGKKPKIPVLVIINQYMTTQKFIKSDLLSIRGKINENDLNLPIITIVGEIVKKYNENEEIKKINISNDDLTLKNKKVVITRPSGQSDQIAKSLELLGATVIRFPVIKVYPLDNEYILDEFINNIKIYKWVIFTSVNGVRVFFNKINERNFDLRNFYGTKFAVVGSATAEELRKNGILADFIPEKYTVNDLKEGLKQLTKEGDKILLLRSDIANTTFVKEFEEIGVVLDERAIYSTKSNEIDGKWLYNSLKENDIDFIAFTSPSTVNAFIKIMGEDVMDLLKNTKLIAIGPVTAREMSKVGIEISAVSDVYNQDGLVRKIEEISNETS